ncbi:unnamed protein product [Prunus armeniaca]
MEVTTTSSTQGDDKYAAPKWRRLASRGLQGFPNNSPMERSWAWQPMNVPTMKIFLWKFLQAKRLILVFVACQLGF